MSTAMSFVASPPSPVRSMIAARSFVARYGRPVVTSPGGVSIVILTMPRSPPVSVAPLMVISGAVVARVKALPPTPAVLYRTMMRRFGRSSV